MSEMIDNARDDVMAAFDTVGAFEYEQTPMPEIQDDTQEQQSSSEASRVRDIGKFLSRARIEYGLAA